MLHVFIYSRQKALIVCFWQNMDLEHWYIWKVKRVLTELPVALLPYISLKLEQCLSQGSHFRPSEQAWGTGFVKTCASSLTALAVEKYPTDNCAGIEKPVDAQ